MHFGKSRYTGILLPNFFTDWSMRKTRFEEFLAQRIGVALAS